MKISDKIRLITDDAKTELVRKTKEEAVRKNKALAILEEQQKIRANEIFTEELKKVENKAKRGEDTHWISLMSWSSESHPERVCILAKKIEEIFKNEGFDVETLWGNVYDKDWGDAYTCDIRVGWKK